MGGGTIEVHKDDDYLCKGTHDGADSAAVLRDLTYHFESVGVVASLGQYVENVTQSTAGNITAVDGNTVTVDGVTWDNGDEFKIYKTATKNQVLSSVWVDLSRGWKTDRDELIDGWKPEDIDPDRKNPGRVFGPNQPDKSHGG